MYSSQLRAFHAVATQGGFTRAAEKLGLTQPAVSDHVRKLEQRFDVQLFHRHKRTVFPTELGLRLLEITRRQFELEDEALELLRESQALKAGSLRIASAAPLHIMAIVAAFRQKYPGVSISLSQGNSDQVLERLRTYQADIGEIGLEPEASDLLVLPLRRDPLVAFVAAGHDWAGRRHITMAQLCQGPLVLRERGSITRQLVEQELERQALKPATVLEVEGREAACEAVAAGLGAGLVSEPEFGHDRRLVCIPLRDSRAEMCEAIACLADRAKLRVIDAFLTEARLHLNRD